MPIWEGVVASFCAGVAVSLLNRFGLSQIPTPCELRRKMKQKRARGGKSSSSSSSDGSDDGNTLAAVADISILHHGAGGE